MFRYGEISSAASRRTLVGTWSGPFAFCGFNFSSNLAIPPTWMSMFGRDGMLICCKVGMLVGSSSVNTESYCLFSISAFPLLSVTSMSLSSRGDTPERSRIVV